MLSDINGYRVKSEWFIGKGSFGSVYKTEKSGKFYAIKIFRSELLQTQYRSRMDREVRVIQKIQHPNVVKLHSFGTFKDKEFEYFYIVMDLIEGQPLLDYVGTLDEKKCLQVVESILDTLESVHSQGIIHRDLKPDNIIINRKNIPIILDLGLAKLIDYSSLTQTGERVGTFSYMSPEQVTDSKNVDPRSDYFALGVIVYQLLVGILPYDATNLPALIDQIKNRYPKNPSELNPNISNHIENVILKLLEKEPHQRYQTIAEIKNALKTSPKKLPKKLDLSTKHYIRLLHNEKGVFQTALAEKLITGVIYPSNFFKFFHPTVGILKKAGVPFTTDPATSRMTYTAFSKTKGVQELPYSSGSAVTPTQKKDFHAIRQVQDYVKSVLEFQIKNGVTELAAPFFYAKGSTDDWFDINLKLIKESVVYRDKHHKDLPVWAGICMNVENWHDQEEKNKILNYYVRTCPDGYFVYGDPISVQSNITQLFHYADLLKKLQLSSSVPVVACRVNGLGLVLLAYGIAGISSGIAGLDSFKESILSDTTEGYSSDPRYYVPKLLTMITLPKRVTTKLTDISRSSAGAELLCNCKYCSSLNSGILIPQDMKLHFLQRRKEEIEELIAINAEARLSFIGKEIDQAIEYSKILTKERIRIGDLSHLQTWKHLVEELKKKS